MAATSGRASELNTEKQLRILNEVTRVVVKSIELDAVLSSSLSAVMDAFEVTAGGIYLIDSETGRLVLQVSQGLTRAFLAEKSDVSPGSGCAGWAADHGKVFAASNEPEAAFICEDAERLMGLDCFLASAISTKRRVHGVIELFAPTSRRLTKSEAELTELISDQIGIAVENARLYEETRVNVLQLTELQKELAATNKRLQAHLRQELHIAEMLQKSFLPKKLPVRPNLRIATRLISATAAADIGGDFYDFIELDDDRIAIIVGDVCGSGIEVATLTAMAKHTIRSFAREEAQVKSLLERANRVICVEAGLSKFIALFLGILDLKTNELEYCVAGQPPPLLVKRGRELVELEAGSIPLGIEPETSYDAKSVLLESEDVILLFTDGLVEARRGKEMFGEERVKKLLKDKFDQPLDNLVDDILVAAKAYSGGNLRDDVAIVAVRLR